MRINLPPFAIRIFVFSVFFKVLPIGENLGGVSLSSAQNISINTTGAANSTSSMLKVLQSSAAAGQYGLVVRGGTLTAAAYVAEFQNSSGTNLFRIYNSGKILAGDPNQTLWIGVNPINTITATGCTNINGLASITSGNYNTNCGYAGGDYNQTGVENTTVGAYAAYYNVASRNTAVGMQTQIWNSSGTNNTNIGWNAGYGYLFGSYSSNTTCIGAEAGGGNNGGGGGIGAKSIGSGNIFLGNQAGMYETGSDKLFIDNQNRTNEATGRTNAMIYGVFNATPTLQTLTLNANVIVGSAAIATSATDGFLYIPTCAGVPTGTPTTHTGTAAIVIDSTNNKMYIYSGGAWVALN